MAVVESSRVIRRGKSRVVFLSALTSVSFAAYACIYPSDQSAAYFLLPFRFWELGAGAILSLTFRRRPQAQATCARFCPPLIPFSFTIAALFAPERYTMAATVASVVGTTALIASVRAGSVIHSILTHYTFVSIGLISYSLYLWHWSVICLSRWTIGIHPSSVPLQLFFMFALATISYHAIEKPVRRGAWPSKKWTTVCAGILALSGSASVVLMSQRLSFPHFSGDPARESERVGAAPGYKAKFSGREVTACFAASVFAGSDAQITDKMLRCTAGHTSSTRLIFFGDSHAADLLPMSELIYKAGVASVLNLSQPGCTVPALPQEGEGCSYPDILLRRLNRDHPETSILVIRNNYSPKFADGSLGKFASTIEHFLDETSAIGLKVVYFAPAPKYYGVGPTSLCSRQWFRPQGAIAKKCAEGFTEERNEQAARRKDFFRYLSGLEVVRSGFYVYDPFEVLCGVPGTLCSPLRGERLIYRDPSHLTEEGSELLSAPFVEFLRQRDLVAATP